MARPLAKSPFVLLALGLWILVCPRSFAEDDDPNALNQEVSQLIEQGKYQEAIPIAERAVEVAKRAVGPEDPETADAMNNFGLLLEKIGDYAKALPLLQEVLRIRQKVHGPARRFLGQSILIRRTASMAWLGCTSNGRERQSRTAPSGSAPDPPEALGL